MKTFQRVRRFSWCFPCLLLISAAVLLTSCGAKDDLPLCDPDALLRPEDMLPGGSPTNEGEIIDTLTPTFSWTYPDPECEPEYYMLKYAASWHELAESPEEIRVDGDRSEWLADTELQARTTYIWQLWAGSGARTGGGGLGIFRTGPVCDLTSPAVLLAPTLRWPENGDSVDLSDLTLEWFDPTVCIAQGDYIIEISERADFSEEFVGGYGFPYLFVAPPWIDFELEECTTYYWRVHFDPRGGSDDEDGPYSETWTFNTTSSSGVLCPPGPLVTLAPEPEVEIPPEGDSAIVGHVWHDECAVPYESTDEPPEGCVSMADGGFEANGIYDAGETGIAEVVVRLGTGPCPVEDGWTAETDETGQYSFTELLPGTYCVSVDALEDGNDLILVPGSWTFPERWYGPGPIEYELTLGASQILREVNFGWDYQFLPEPVSAIPLARFLQNAHCRLGPDTVYDIVTSLSEGQEAFIEGRNAENTWWWIKLPQSTTHCWVADSVVEIIGLADALPIIQALPTSTPIQGCWVWNANLQQDVCTVPCPPNPQPGGACTP